MINWRKAIPTNTGHDKRSLPFERRRNLVVTGPLTANNTVANNNKYGNNFTKVDCDVCTSNSAPNTPPTRLVTPSTITNTRLCFAISNRYAHILATEPGHNATVLVAFALIGGTPVKIRAGKVINVPPPATELSIPPNIAATNRIMICENVISQNLPKKVLTNLLPCSNIKHVKRTAC